MEALQKLTVLAAWFKMPKARQGTSVRTVANRIETGL
jgi:hypothetical protein